MHEAERREEEASEEGRLGPEARARLVWCELEELVYGSVGAYPPALRGFEVEMAAQAAVRLQSTMLTLMRSTQAGQDLLDHDAGPMRQQAAARSIQRIYRKRMKERKRRHQKDAELRASRVALALSKKPAMLGRSGTVMLRSAEMGKLERKIAADKLVEWVRSSAYQAVSRSRRAACVVVQAYARRRLARREGRARRAKLEEQRARRVSVMAARTQEDIGVAASVIQLHCRQARRTLNFKVARYEASAWAHGSALSLRAEGAPPAVALEQLSVELEQKARRAQRRLADVELAPKAKAKAKAVALAAKETAVVAQARSRVAPELRAKLAGWGKRFGQGAAQLTPDEEAAAVARLRRSFVEADARLRALGGGGGGGASAGAVALQALCGPEPSRGCTINTPGTLATCH